MEHENPNLTQPAEDPVSETLERLDMADTLEDLRHHIDDLIARLSEQEKEAAPPTPHRSQPGDLEGQIENLGDKVESASCLLAELADLLEAQTERIETIEQQLGDPELAMAYPHAPTEGQVPRFTMRPAPDASPSQTEPQPQAVPDPAEAIRRYLETRFERLEAVIRQLDERITGLRLATEERERYVRDLEARLLLLVETPPTRTSAEAEAHSPEARSAARPEAPGRESGPDEFDLVGQLPPRPAHMPVFAHDAARARRRLVRRAAFVSPPSVAVLRSGPLSMATAEPMDVPVSPEAAGTERPGVASWFARSRSRAVQENALPIPATHSPGWAEQETSIPQPASFAMHAAMASSESPSPMIASAEAEASVVATSPRAAATGIRNGTPDRLSRATRPAGLDRPERAPDTLPRAVRELERLVERDVSLHRDFRFGPSDTARPAKAHPTVMVVDDAPDALTVLSIYLSKTGYQVVTATSAEDCLAKLRHHAIDALVLDAKMPGASGEHVCRVLREDPAYAHRRDVPVIVYTGYPDDFPADVRDEWRADEYVVKGGDMLPLMRALVRHTSREATS